MRKCYKCNEIGHRAKECVKDRKPVICYACKREGHIASRCKYNTEPNSEKISILSTQNVDVFGEKFIRDIKLNGNMMKAQIDMGSSVCTIKATAMLNADLKMERMESVLEGFGGDSSVSPGIVTAEIKLDNLNSKKVQLRIVPDDAQSWDVILGRPFTEALDITYERAGHNLIFANIDPSLFKEGNPGGIKSRSLEIVEIESGTIQFIKVSSNTGKVKMPVYNIAKDTKIVKAGDQIGETIRIVEDARKLEPRYKEIKSDEVITGDSITDLQKT